MCCILFFLSKIILINNTLNGPSYIFIVMKLSNTSIVRRPRRLQKPDANVQGACLVNRSRRPEKIWKRESCGWSESGRSANIFSIDKLAFIASSENTFCLIFQRESATARDMTCIWAYCVHERFRYIDEDRKKSLWKAPIFRREMKKISLSSRRYLGCVRYLIS